jgi:hypothetical protein
VTVASPAPSDRRRNRLLSGSLVLAMLVAALAPAATVEIVRGLTLAAADHLVVSEVVTGGASASDELIELHNPTAVALPLEGLELIYVTASGATISRRAAWALGAPSVPGGGHVLIANAAGVYGPIADATYASGMAATGGSVAIRILGATTAIDAVGWGDAANAWLEGSPSVAPSAGASLERLPGGALGSGQDTDDNQADFVERLVPGPQNLGSPPTPDPAATLAPSVTPDPTPIPPPPTPGSTPIPTAPPPSATAIADARSAPDGSTVTIEAVALAGSDFHDGGGFLADPTGGIAVLVSDGSFRRGERLRVTGEIDDRFSQRTLRAGGGALLSLGTAAEPAPVAAATGGIDESVEGRLVRIAGQVVGSPTTLTAGLAFDVDDGSGIARLVVGTATAIDTDAWVAGATVDVVGVVGQRDSSGSGTDGYRVLPRDASDVVGLTSPGGSSPPPGGGEGVTSIANARRAAEGTSLTVRGVITLPTGLVDERTAVVQDATGAILLRLGTDVGGLKLGARIEVSGARSTLAGMESLRVSDRVTSLGAAAQPAARQVRTGGVEEADEAVLVMARGAIVSSARRSSKGTVFFEIDDGSGPLSVSVSARLAATSRSLVGGTWVEVRGVLGQETSRAEPNEGYRIWPRTRAEVRVTAPAMDGTGAEPDGSGSGGIGGPGGGSDDPAGSLDDLDAVDLVRLRIGATLVIGRWPELGVAGLLWDGSHLVAVHPSSQDVVARLTRGQHAPVALDLIGLQAAGVHPSTSAPVVRLGRAADQAVVLDEPPVPPRSALTGEMPAWVSVVGRLSGPRAHRVLVADGKRVTVVHRCDERQDTERAGEAVSVTGVALGDPLRLLVPCDGVRPAPTVAGGQTLGGQGTKAASTARTSTGIATDDDARRPLTAGLLMAAAAALVGGAAILRRREAGPEDPEEPSDAGDEGEPGGRLTLVQVPQEGGR